jgi:hypothetical protein
VTVSNKYAGKKAEEQFKEKPGRYWGVVGRKNLKLGQREVRTLTEKEVVRLRRVIRRYPGVEDGARKTEAALALARDVVWRRVRGQAAVQC